MARVQQPGTSDGGVSRRPSAIAVPPRADMVLLPIAILAVSTSGPLMAAAAQRWGRTDVDEMVKHSPLVVLTVADADEWAKVQ